MNPAPWPHYEQDEIDAVTRVLRSGKVLESRDSAAGLRAEQVAKGEKLRAPVDEYRSLRLQVAMLDQFIEDLAKSGDFPLLEEAGRYLASLTHDRYRGFEVVEDGEHRHIDVLLAGSQTAENRMELRELSTGTADQVFLALRLAGIRARQQERVRAGLPPLPVVLDDVLVDHDDERSRAALELIAEISAEMPIIVLTHHGAIGDMAEAINGIERVDLGN